MDLVSLVVAASRVERAPEELDPFGREPARLLPRFHGAREDDGAVLALGHAEPPQCILVLLMQGSEELIDQLLDRPSTALQGASVMRRRFRRTPGRGEYR